MADGVTLSGDIPLRMCNCACQRCLSGRCCMWPDVTPDTPLFRTYATTTAAVVIEEPCGPSGHDFQPGYGTSIFCRKCGQFRSPSAQEAAGG